jgi:His/Glu/Gln/Arg/opine family amino acid ABC transporter permease subunit
MILDGLQMTLLITLCAVLMGTVLGGLVCWMRMNKRTWLQQVAKVYIDLMRGTPVLVLLMLMYYVVMAPLDATGFVVAIVTFGMNTAAYISEMLRGIAAPFQSIDAEALDTKAIKRILNVYEDYADSIDEVLGIYKSIWKMLGEVGSEDESRIDVLGKGLISMIAYMQASLSILTKEGEDASALSVKINSFAASMETYQDAVKTLAEAFELAPEDFTKYENVQKALNKTGINGGSIFATSFVRMIKNTDPSVNGGKDVLLLCNLTATETDAAQLRLYAYKDGVDAAPTQIAGYCYDAANNVNDWRRYGDRFFVEGDWSNAKVYFPSYNPEKIVVLSIANGARTAVTQINAGENSPSGIKDLTVYPGDNKLFLTNVSIANLVAPTGGKVKGWDEYSLSASSAEGVNTWGYNFFEFNGKKYIAYARIIGETKARIEIIEDKGDLLSSLAAKEGLMTSPIHDATDLEKEVGTGNLADCCVRVIGDEVYIAALTRDGGFVLDKLYMK